MDTSKNMNVSKKYFFLSPNILPWEKADLLYDSSLSEGQNYITSIYRAGNDIVRTEISASDSLHFIKASRAVKTGKWLIIKRPTGDEVAGYNFYLSIPIFSVNGSFALLKEYYHCGQDCGEVKIVLYKRTKTGWQFGKLLSGAAF